MEQFLIDLTDDLLGDFDGALYDALGFFLYLGGVTMVFIALLKMARLSNFGAQPGPTSPWAGPVMTALIGVIFISLPAIINILVNTGFEESSPLSYGGVGDDLRDELGITRGAERMIGALIAVVQFVGFVAIIRAFWLLKQNAEGQSRSGVGAAIIHLIAGVLAMNIVGLAEVVSESSGVEILVAGHMFWLAARPRITMTGS